MTPDRHVPGMPPVVLVVDDTPANLSVAVACLEDRGLDVAVARDGEEALRRAPLLMPDLILLDVVMPGIDGLETCRQLKAQPETREIPVILMTSLSQTSDKILGFRAGAVDYLIKPLQVEEIVARVMTHLDLRARTRLLEVRNAELRREIDTRKQAEADLLDVLQSVRNANHAIAHDLRTPLTEVRARLEMLSLTRPDPEKTFSEIDIAVDDIDRVIGIFNALLRLAEIDAGLRRSGFVQVALAEVAEDIAEFYQPLAELRGIALELRIDAPAWVEGDPQLIAQALGNLLDNALKYAPRSGRVEVRLSCLDAAAHLSVSDDGPGVPDDEIPKVVQRFYRGDASRGTPGVGLGLALVVAVAKLHRGSLDLADNAPGLRATLTLPLAR